MGIYRRTYFITGNIDNENNIFQKKKHNYDIREKIAYEIHYLFIIELSFICYFSTHDAKINI